MGRMILPTLTKAICSILFLLALAAAQANTAPGDSEARLKALLDGAADARSAALQYSDFVRAFRARHQNNVSTYTIYNQYLDAVGVRRISNYLETEDAACHGVAHGLGRAIGERVPDLREAMSVCGSTCTYGCVHGVFKRYFVDKAADEPDHSHHQHNAANADKPDQSAYDRFAAEALAACREDSRTVDGFYRGNCAHAVGHAFGSLEADIDNARRACDMFDGEEMRYYCATGVFMERGGEIRRGLFDKGVTRSDKQRLAVEYCGRFEQHAGACLRFVAHAISTREEADGFRALCRDLAGAARGGCFNALGFLTRTFTAKNLDVFTQVCSGATQHDRSACVIGLLLTKPNQRHRKSLEQACENVGDEPLTSLCKDQLQRNYYQVGNPAMQQLLRVAQEDDHAQVVD